MIYFLILFSLLSFSYPLLIEQNELKSPTLRLSINGDNLQDIENFLIKRLVKETQIPVETIQISENVDLLGKLDIIINNTIIKITNLTDVEFYLTFVEERNINPIIEIFNVEINFDYIFKTELMSGEGNGTIFINDVSLALNSTIIQVPNEYEPEKLGPGIKINAITINDLNMNIAFSKNSTLEKTLKYFNKNLKNIAIKIAENELNKKAAIDPINDKLYLLFKRVKLNIPIDNLLQTNDNISISFSMNEMPFVKNNVLEIPLEIELKGENYYFNQTNDITLPKIITNPSLFTEKTINGVISQFVFNNVLDVLYFFGKFEEFEITNNTLGIEEFSVGLISIIISEIGKNYKASQKAKIIANTIDSPFLKFKDNNHLVLNIVENLKFFIYNETENLSEDIGTIPVDADSELEIKANFYVNNTDIQLTLTSITMLNFDVKKTLIGEINTENVKQNFNNFISFVLKNINDEIKKKIQDIEIPLIIEEFILDDLVAKSCEGYLKFDLSPILASLNKLFNY